MYLLPVKFQTCLIVLSRSVMRSNCYYNFVAIETSLKVEKKIHPNNPHTEVTTPRQQIGIVDLDQAYIKLNPAYVKFQPIFHNVLYRG